MKKKIGRDGDKSLESGANSRVSTLCCLQTTSHLYPRKQQCCTSTVHIDRKRIEMRKKRRNDLEPGAFSLRATVSEKQKKEMKEKG